MQQTRLHAVHVELDGRMVDFAGWEMPLLYRGIVEEHVHTRTAASFFDVSHMGRIAFRGADAAAFLDRICTRRIGDMAVGVSRYGHVCRDDGGILDDVIISRDEDHHLMVCNASNREKLLGWFAERRSGAVEWEDRTLETAMLAVQGPSAIPILEQLLPLKLADLKRYHFRSISMLGQTAWFFRSGYTGEDGVEVIAPAQFAEIAARTLMERSQALGTPILPAGLGARDTLRLEAGMPLYGHELDESIDSISAGQGWAVDLTKDFIGAAAMRRVQEAGPRRKMIGMEIDGRRVARQGAEIRADGATIGVVTSGAPSPTLGRVIAMGFVDATRAEPGSRVEIDLRGSSVTATLCKLPFYKRGK
ncbi:MAG: glycine cleavage system aminomethyltransferase GcvT [Phycisphaerales bacterium]|nr:glycine cleavage system aminomethyltransferase GcvT [Phycisphaerales bacterium]